MIKTVNQNVPVQKTVEISVITYHIHWVCYDLPQPKPNWETPLLNDLLKEWNYYFNEDNKVLKMFQDLLTYVLR